MQLKKSPFAAALLAALLFIPFLGSVHLFDWDEVNFAESAREMLVTGEYFRVQINFQPFWEKPPLFFWLQAASMSIFGINEFAARFPNAICGILTFVLLFNIGKQTINTRFAWLWVLFMAASFTPALYFKSGIIDPWFNLFIFFAIWQLSLASRIQDANKRTYRFLLIGVSLGLAVLTKGPVALLIAALCVLVFMVRNSFYIFFTFKQIAIAVVCIAAISSLWIAVEVSKNGLGVLQDFIAYQIDLFKNPVAGHGQPWYYHPIVLLFGCFPASIIGIQGFLTNAKTLEEKSLKQWMSILFWVVLILFSIVTTKIVHYSSLCWMPLTFMAAYGIENLYMYKKKMPKLLIVLLVTIGTIISFLLAALPLIDVYKQLIVPHINDKFAIAALAESASWNGFEAIIGIFLMLVVLIASILLWKQQLQKGVYGLLISFMLAIPLYILWVVPKIETYSQQPAIDFYKSLQNKDCYVETIGMKSYAQYFYTQCKPQLNPNYSNIHWLVEGDIDKPAYFVSKINRVEEIRGYGITEIGRKGGFVFWKRESMVK